MTESTSTQRTSPSAASNPDLDWSQIRETVLMLNLAVAQIHHALSEGDESIVELTRVFTEIFGNTATIAEGVRSFPDNDTKQNILEILETISSKVQQTIVCFQFYDRLAQRLCHVSSSLAALGEIVSDVRRIYNPHEWLQLQKTIKAKYTIDSDRKMFEAILNGATVEEVLQQNTTAKSPPATSEEIELFR